ncbi:MAG: ATP-binding protein [Kovacikia sp.]
MARVLVVEDERVIARHLQSVLERLGHTVTGSTDSGIQAIQAAAATKPDVVIMDISLKGNIDGVEAAEQIYQSFNIPVIYLTAYADNATLQRVKRSSPYGFLLKPLRSKDLESTIEIALHRHQLEQSARTTQQQQQDSLNGRLQQVSDQFYAGVACIQLLQNLLHQLGTYTNEIETLKVVLHQLGQSLQANYCWLTRYDEDKLLLKPFQGKATIIGEYIQDGLQEQPSLMGQSIDLERYPNFYLSLVQRKFWISPDIDVLPEPYQSLASSNRQLFVCLLCNEQIIIGEIGIVTANHRIWSEQQIELIAGVIGQAVISLRQMASSPASQVGNLESFDQLRDDFISSVSHELRTPLTNMRMAVEMVERVANSLKTAGTNLESKQNSQLLWQRMERYLQVLHEEWNQEFNLINDLLDFQNPESFDASISLAPLNLTEWLPSLVDRVMLQALQQKQVLTCQVEPTVPVLMTHLPSLERIMVELLNNALKYTPGGHQILVTAHSEDAHLKLSVTNTGITIPLKEQEQIFHPFHRVSRPNSWNYSGTGLGLALVKKLVKRLKGRVRVDSQDERTTFTLLLPLKG